MARQAETHNPGPQGARGFSLALAMVVLVAAATAGVGLVLLVQPREDRTEQIPRPPVNVRVERVEPAESLPDTFEVNGVIEPQEEVRVAAEVAGQVEEIPVEEGRSVRKGQVIVRLDRELIEAEYNRAKAQRDYDARELRRIRSLQERGIATASELDQAITAFEVSEAAFAAGESRLKRTVIKAPLDGVLDRLPVKEGEFVQPGQPVAVLVKMDPVKVVVDVPEKDVRYFRVGQEQRIIETAGRDVELVGEVTYLSEVAEPLARTTRMEITVDNPDRALRGGQIVQVRLKRRDLQNVVMIPLEAVIPMERGHRVYVVEDGKAQPRDVVIDLDFTRGTRVRVASGLATEDLLITRGQRLAGPGREVRIVEQVPAETIAQAPETERAREN